MNRQEKKCFITVASAHGLLVVILFVGPAFFVSSQKSQDFQPVTVYSPAADITKALSGGEKVDNVRAIPLPPAPTPTPEPPKLTPQPIEVPPPPKNEPKPVEKEIDVKPAPKPTLHGDEPVIKPKKHVVQIDDSELTPNKDNAEKLKAEKAGPKKNGPRRRRRQTRNGMQK